MIRQGFYCIQVAFDVRAVDCRNTHITYGAYQRLRSLAAPGGQGKEIIPFCMTNKDDCCRCPGVCVDCGTDAAN